MHRAVFILWFVFFVTSGLFSAPIAESLPAALNNEMISIETIETRILSIEQTIDTFSKTPPEQLARELGTTVPWIQKKLKGLTALQSAYQNFKNATLSLEKSKAEQQTVQQLYDDYRAKGMTQKPPYSLTFHDSIQAEISTIVQNLQNTQFSIEILKKNIEDYKNQLFAKESELRQFKEKAEKQSNPENSLEQEILELSILQLKVMIQSFSIERTRYEIIKENAVIHTKRLKEQEAFISANIQHDKLDLDHQLDLILKKENDIQGEIRKFKSDQTTVEAEWRSARQNLNTADSVEQRIVAQAYLRARDEWRKTYIVALELKYDSLKLVERQKIVWQHRYEIVKGELSFSQKKQIHDEAKKNSNSLNQTLQIQQNYLINLQKQISAIESLIQEEGTLVSIKHHLATEKDALLRQLERRLEFQSMLITTDQIEQNLLAQIEDQMNQPTIKDKFSRLTQTVHKIWTLEIWVVDQNSVSVGKIFTALFILVVGIVLARFFVNLVHKKIVAASQFKDTTSSAVHKALSYSIYLMVFLMALRIVNIPLTAFAFLGGAIAIGVGFGAQNLINNIISGFIILGEQPIHIGDLIEVDGVLGKVEEIGARCTRVRTGENIHKLIPNSSFLEKNITNWTLSDNKIRTKVVVGVAYGSDVQKVEAALIQSVKANENVLKYPEPFVLFADFGDNALFFEVYFWVMVRMVLEKKQIESQVRFGIDSAFRQDNIVIAFPQRDLHFETDRPLSIQLIKPPAS